MGLGATKLWQPDGLCYLFRLPSELCVLIGLKLSFKDIFSLSRTCKRLKGIYLEFNFLEVYLKQLVVEPINYCEFATNNWFFYRITQYQPAKALGKAIEQKKAQSTYDLRADYYDFFQIVERLLTVTCDRCGLTSFPIIRHLTYLSCNDNQITSLPMLENLEELYCYNNKLKTILLYPKLRFLNCSGNQIESLPFLKNLRILKCSSNQLTVIPYYEYLEILVCRNNKIASLDSYCKLKELDCDYNPIGMPPYMRSLEKLSYGGKIYQGEKLETWKWMNEPSSTDTYYSWDPGQ